jgi:integrase
LTLHNDKTMAAIKLLVKSKRKEQMATVYLRFVDGREVDFTVPTGLKVFPEYWNNSSQTFKQRLFYTKSFTENDKKKLETDFLELKTAILTNYNNRETPRITKEWLLEAMASVNVEKRGLDDGRLNLNQYIDLFIKQIEAGQRTYNHNNRSEKFKPLTIKNYKGFQGQFNKFQDQGGRSLNFNDINIEFYDDFVRYFNDKNYSPNTIGRHIKNLKTIMRIAREEGLHSSNEIDRRKFKVIRQSVDKIYLTEREVQKLYELKLPLKADDQTRDVFLVGCYTAQRFSDYSSIAADDIKVLENGLQVIDFYQKKTNERVIIPIRRELRAILEKYAFKLPRLFEQKVNERIKDLAEQAEITEPITVQSTKGGVVTTESVTKNKLVTTHTARRSGCTNMYLAGVPVLDIMKISGHKTEKEFLNYIKVSKEETALNLSKHPYFM